MVSPRDLFSATLIDGGWLFGGPSCFALFSVRSLSFGGVTRAFLLMDSSNRLASSLRGRILVTSFSVAFAPSLGGGGGGGGICLFVVGV